MLAGVEAVGQGVMDLDRVGEEDPVPVGEVLSPGDPGDGVILGSDLPQSLPPNR